MADEFAAEPDVVVVLMGQQPDPAGAERLPARLDALRDRMPTSTTFVIARTDPEIGALEQAAIAPAEGRGLGDIDWVGVGGELLELDTGEATQIQIARDGQVSIGDAVAEGVLWRAAKVLTISFDWGDHRPPGEGAPPPGKARFRCPFDDVYFTVDIGAPATCPLDAAHPTVPA